MRRFVYVLAIGGLGGGGAFAGSRRQGFVDKAATGGMAEVQLSKLAMDKAQSAEVKQFARKMVEDHTKADLQLKQIAEKKDIAVPSAMETEHQKTYDRLAQLEGADFDKQYMRAMAKDHDQTVKLFQEQSRTAAMRSSSSSR